LKRKKTLCAVFLLLSFTTLWNCSSHPKVSITAETVEPSAPIENQIPQPVAAEEQAAKVEEKKVEESVEPLPQEEAVSEEKEDPMIILEEALDAYQDSQLAWEKGDLDTALQALDEAYRLLLKLELPSDSPLIQDKNELRLLIAQRIQEIYASRLAAVGINHQTIPVVENKYVLDEIKIFQTKERDYFDRGYRLSGRYRPLILEELRKAGLPEELSWLPLIESWFNVKAYSRARALGLWQFISSTGYRFGLKRDRWVEERMDPVKSTRAATRYLTELHSLFGDWTTALASYNCGEFKVQRVINSQHIKYLDNFWDLYVMLPVETARFVPRFMAALLVIKSPEKYGFNLPQPDPPLSFDEIVINKPVRLSSLSEAMGLKDEDLASLNPELIHGATPDEEYILRVPVDCGELTLSALNSLPRYVPLEATAVSHYVRRGETLSQIAERYGTSVQAIARLNRLNRVHLIRAGQRLRVPVRGSSASASPVPALIKDGEKLVYVVRRGDTLYQIASAFGTTVDKIKDDNNLESSSLTVGQKIVIQSGKPEGAAVYSVVAGDTLFDIARKYGMELSTLLTINGLSSRSKIYPGQELWVIPKNSK
jgi:membrane-bound lytic murein transglycosylase D